MRVYNSTVLDTTVTAKDMFSLWSVINKYTRTLKACKANQKSSMIFYSNTNLKSLWFYQTY